MCGRNGWPTDNSAPAIGQNEQVSTRSLFTVSSFVLPYFRIYVHTFIVMTICEYIDYTGRNLLGHRELLNCGPCFTLHINLICPVRSSEPATIAV